jgi:tetratricopeptide (TPR) repeat protein
MDQPPQPPPRITFEEIIVWLDERRKLILFAVVLIGLAGLAIVVYDAGVEGKERATAALFNLQAAAAARTNDPTASDYQALRPATEGTGIFQHVKLREATSLYTAGQYAEALQAFDAFSRDFPGSPLLPEASLGAAASLEAQGKSSEALARYQEVTTRFPESSLTSRARLGQARLFEQQGDQQQAFRIYQDLAAQTAGGMGQFGQTSPLQMEASIAARRLVKANPALLQTNAPNVTPLIAPTNVPATSQQQLLTDPSNVPLPVPPPSAAPDKP